MLQQLTAIRPQILAFALLMLVGTAGAQAYACLTPTGPVTAKVEVLAPNPAGLEQLRVRVDGFELAALTTPPVGCTLGLGLEAQITGPPLYAIQKRTVTSAVTVVDATGNTSTDFFIDPAATDDLIGETIGHRYFDWPVPVAFVPFTVDIATVAPGSLPSGEVELIFEVVVKPPYSVQDVIDDLNAFGHVASDFSIHFSGTTYLLWTSWPLVTEIDFVELE